MEIILDLISGYGLETVLLALGINILTGVLKLPVKRLAGKMKWEALTKAVVFLPLLIGFGGTMLYTYFMRGAVRLDGGFFTLWLSSTSLSLAIYAVLEKLIPSKRKILQDYEIRQNLEAVEKLRELNKTEPKISEEAAGTTEESELSEAILEKKIILKGKKDVD